MKDFNAENLIIGDKVIVVVISGYTNRSKYVGEVIKKTPKGLLDVRYNNSIVRRYRPNGSQYAKRESYASGWSFLERCTKNKVEAINNANKRSDILRFLKGCAWEEYGDDQLADIYECVKSKGY